MGFNPKLQGLVGQDHYGNKQNGGTELHRNFY
jgi:hypothetical protein